MVNTLFCIEVFCYFIHFLPKHHILAKTEIILFLVLDVYPIAHRMAFNGGKSMSNYLIIYMLLEILEK